MNPFDSYMLNKVRRLKNLRTRYAATGVKELLAGVPRFQDAMSLDEYEGLSV